VVLSPNAVSARSRRHAATRESSLSSALEEQERNQVRHLLDGDCVFQTETTQKLNRRKQSNPRLSKLELALFIPKKAFDGHKNAQEPKTKAMELSKSSSIL